MLDPNNSESRLNSSMNFQRSGRNNNHLMQSPQQVIKSNMMGSSNNNIDLMSPIGQSNRHNFMNDTRHSMQSSMIKPQVADNSMMQHQLNSSFGAMSGISALQQSTMGPNIRVI